MSQKLFEKSDLPKVCEVNRTKIFATVMKLIFMKQTKIFLVRMQVLNFVHTKHK